ncbi:hypothetical protein Tco_1304371 [Tanacetum coccineum]
MSEALMSRGGTCREKSNGRSLFHHAVHSFCINKLSPYTSSSKGTDSEPGRVFWGADEELSDDGSPRVIVYGYDGLPMQPTGEMMEMMMTGDSSRDDADDEDEDERKEERST